MGLSRGVLEPHLHVTRVILPAGEEQRGWDRGLFAGLLDAKPSRSREVRHCGSQVVVLVPPAVEGFITISARKSDLLSLKS